MEYILFLIGAIITFFLGYYQGAKQKEKTTDIRKQIKNLEDRIFANEQRFQTEKSQTAENPFA